MIETDAFIFFLFLYIEKNVNRVQFRANRASLRLNSVGMGESVVT